MNGLRLTDAQISKALRARLPARAQAGLRERILEAAETTAQQRALPSFIGALSDADPVTRRRSLLIAAALLVAVAVATVAAVGALRLLDRDPIEHLSLEPPTDLPAFVLSSYERVPQLPPVALTWHDTETAKGRIYVHRSGAVRFDRFMSAEATDPSSYSILSGNRISGMAPVESEAVWIEPGHEAIEDDPRVFIRTILSRPGEGPGCEMERDPSDVSGTAATGWRYVGLEYVAGRPTHHVACVGDLSLDLDLWLDIETRLILRTREPLTDDAGQPIPGQFGTTEVTEIAFGEQPAALFEPPEGVTRISPEAYGAYICTRDLPNELVAWLGVGESCSTPNEAEATPLPTSTPMPAERPGPTDCAIPLGGPSEPTGPLAWTQESLQLDWPAPVRPEPAGGASVVPMPPTYIDPSGDTGSDVLPCVDIRDVTVDSYVVSFDLVSNRPPDVDPSKAWIAFGVVVDEDRDGVPDWRYGIDNLPRTAGDDKGHHRAWRTDLHTGRTESDPLPRTDRPYRGEDGGQVGDTFLGSSYPVDAGDDARFRFGRVSDTTGGTVTRGVKVVKPLYAWASVIVDGRVVATDYAPDAGWILPSPGANPGGTYVLPGVAGARLPFRLSMSVPNGWTANGPFVGPDRESYNGIGLQFMIIDRFAGGCDASGEAIEAHVGPKVEDLVTFLASLRMIKISENTDVTLDGYRGKYLEYTTTLRDDNCYPQAWPLFTNQNDNHEFTQAWILDVDGVRLVIDAFAPKASETVKAEFRQIVESIDIGP